MAGPRSGHGPISDPERRPASPAHSRHTRHNVEQQQQDPASPARARARGRKASHAPAAFPESPPLGVCIPHVSILLLLLLALLLVPLSFSFLYKASQSPTDVRLPFSSLLAWSTRSPSDQGDGPTICWSSVEAGGYLASADDSSDSDSGGRDGNSEQSAAAAASVKTKKDREGAGPELPFGPGAVVFFGRGGKECVAGDPCAFELLLRSPAHWLPSFAPRQRELLVFLQGPALASAQPQELAPMDGTRYRFTYQLWDAGTYRVSVRNNCGSLAWSPRVAPGEAQELASWHLTVHPLQPPNPVLLHKGPCALASIPGRWTRAANGSYRWMQHPCARTVPVENWIPELNRAGIREISFIGDSHQRVLLHHLLFLLEGRVDSRHRRYKGSVSYTVTHKGGGSLRLNLLFVKGIYVANGPFGCNNTHRKSDQPEWPKLSLTADVNIIESGYWTGAFCSDPESEFAFSLPKFIKWIEDGLQNSTSSNSSSNSSVTRPRLVYRSTPPRPTVTLGCDGLSNVYIQYVNDVAKGISKAHQMAYFDAHGIEAPLVEEACEKGHFSCLTNETVTGLVGEAVVYSLVHFLLRYARRQ